MSTLGIGASAAFPIVVGRSVTPGMTIREYAAIYLKVPDSGNEALDAMIRRARRDDLAQAIVQGLAADPSIHNLVDCDTAAYLLADKILNKSDRDAKASA